MIHSRRCLQWQPDLPGPAGASAIPAVSYTTSGDTILNVSPASLLTCADGAHFVAAQVAAELIREEQ
jgi:hypothetical protein